MAKEAYQLILSANNDARDWFVALAGNHVTQYPEPAVGFRVKPSRGRNNRPNIDKNDFLVQRENLFETKSLRATPEERKTGWRAETSGKIYYASGIELLRLTDWKKLRRLRMHTPAYWANPKPRADKGKTRHERLYRAAIDYLKGETPDYIMPGDPFFSMGGIERVTFKSAVIAYVWEIPGVEKFLAVANKGIYNFPGWNTEDAIGLFSRFCAEVDPIPISNLNRQSKAAEEILLASLKNNVK